MERSTIIERIVHIIETEPSDSQHTIDHIILLIEKFNSLNEWIRFSMIEFNEILDHLTDANKTKARKIFDKIDQQRPGLMYDYIPDLSRAEKISVIAQANQILNEYTPGSDTGKGGR